ncbi:hypothetical protein ABZZ47_40110 [Streptomyces sp. NPDC006465]|uniref:hypothetical protein n=1 Tax=Streptomyces sp. NPDC006465 TaxID=3157174 RepID=UPI0033A2D8AD
MTDTAPQAARQAAPQAAPPFGLRRRARWAASPGPAARPAAGAPGRTDRSTTGVTR